MPSDANSISLPDLLASIEELELRKATVAAELSGGPVSRSWQLDTTLGPLVLRLDLPLAAKLGLDRVTEIGVLKSASAAGIGPELVWADPERGLLLTRLLPGRSWTEEDISKPTNLVRLGTVFRQLHSMPVVHKARDLRVVLASYADLLDTVKARSIYSSAEKLLDELASIDSNTVFCHKDAHCRNIIDNGGLRLIDWEYAGAGDPCLDLAVVAQQHQLKAWQLNYLLDGYGGSPFAIDRQRLQQFCRLYDYVAVLWYMLVSSESLQCGSRLNIPRHYC
jgi:thiamine kinase-like enzyme